MIPFLFFVPTSTIELCKPKIEFVSCFTTIENSENDYMTHLNRFLGEDLNICDYINYIGTTITSPHINKFIQIDESSTDFYSGDYDITVKMPKVMIMSKKIKIKSISKFKPKVIL